MLKSFLFPREPNTQFYSLLLLAMRLLFGVLFFTHGYQKFMNYETLANGAFPDPLGISSELSVTLAILSETLCAIAFVFGFLFRLTTLPMIFTMLVAFFVVHQGNVLEGELAFIYLIVFFLMYIAGAGRYSIDHWIARKLSINNSKRA